VQPFSASQPDSANSPEYANVRLGRTDGGNANGGDHAVFVLIQTSTAQIENIHDPLHVYVPSTQDTPDGKV
jgi:hypothetical protein